MNIRRALQIDGWMEENDLRWLADKASQHKRIVEVGCWQGRSTMVLADNTEGTVWAVDHWEGSEELIPKFDWSDPHWVRKIFETNLADHIASRKVLICYGSSIETAKFLSAEAPFDMVFIDASHDYESIKADILAWKPLCNGLLCGHDGGHEPVLKATRELLPGLRNEESMWVYENL